MITGIGLDLCEVSRMQKLLQDDRFLNRFFTPEETAYIRSKGASSAQTMAGIFSAKEALGKALGTGISFELKDAEILHDEHGCPYYCLHGDLPERVPGESFHLSITHDGGVSAAVCIREKAPDSVLLPE